MGHVDRYGRVQVSDFYVHVAGVLSQVDAFQEEFSRQSGINIPIEYFQASVVTGAFDERDALVGGWATAPGAVGRWLSQIPGVEARCAHIAVAETLELNAVWLSAALRGRTSSAEFWRALACDIASRNVTHVVFGVTPRRRGMARLYESMADGILYEGPILNSPLPAVRYFQAAPQRFAEIERLYMDRLRARASVHARRRRLATS